MHRKKAKKTCISVISFIMLLVMIITSLHITVVAQTVEHGYYYSKLDDQQKMFYDIFLQQGYIPSESVVSLIEPITFRASSMDDLKSQWKEKAQELLYSTVYPAYNVFTLDNPDRFWVGNDITAGFPISYSYPQSNPNDLSAEMEKITLDYKPAFSDAEEMDKAFNETLEREFEALNLEEFSDVYSKVKAIHDFVVTYITYDDRADLPRTSFTAYGALVDKTSVCAGYAELFKVLCDKANIECILITGLAFTFDKKANAHEWNAVKMDDGKWYGVDCTWDDQSSICYDFFLVGSMTVPTNFLYQVPFIQSHVASSLLEEDNFNYGFPSLSPTKYQYQPKYIETVSIASKPNKQKYIHNSNELDVAGGELLIKYTDGSETTIPMTKEMVTGFDNAKLGLQTLTVNYKEYSVTFDVEIVEAIEVIGDITGDGKVNIADAMMLYGYISGGIPTLENSSALDLTNDGKVNVADAMKLFSFVSGK